MTNFGITRSDPAFIPPVLQQTRTSSMPHSKVTYKPNHLNLYMQFITCMLMHIQYRPFRSLASTTGQAYCFYSSPLMKNVGSNSNHQPTTMKLPHEFAISVDSWLVCASRDLNLLTPILEPTVMPRGRMMGMGSVCLKFGF